VLTAWQLDTATAGKVLGLQQQQQQQYKRYNRGGAVPD